jgi:hypothetical protein
LTTIQCLMKSPRFHDYSHYSIHRNRRILKIIHLLNQQVFMGGWNMG